MKIDQEKIVIPVTDGKMLKGIVRKPEGSGLFPVVILIPGFGSTMHEANGSFDEIAEQLNQIGILTLQFEFDIFMQDGSMREVPLDLRARQFADVLTWATSLPNIDPKRIGIVAQSYGVPTVLTVDLSWVKSIVLSCGVFAIDSSIRRVFRERGVEINENGDSILSRSNGERTIVGKEFWPSLASFHAIDRLSQLKQPVLMLHGDKDTKISTVEAKQIFAVLPGKTKKLKVLKDGDHGIIDVPKNIRNEYLKEINAWFHETL